jgi:glycosyltransferase involved in cell wall biosynthesis
MRLLLLNLRTDADDTALGFTTAWINDIATHVESVDVITMHAGRLAVAPNVRVYSLGRESGTSRAQRVWRFYRLVFMLTRRGRIDVAFAHMTPLLALMLWPIARIRRVPILLWYAHGALPRDVRVAHRLVDRCVTSTPSGLRISSPKVHVLHQGIDTDRFGPPVEPDPERDRTVLSIGRITESKRLVEVVEVLARLHERGLPMRLRLVGGPITEQDRAYLGQVSAAVRERALDAFVDYVGPIAYSEIPSEYHRGGWFLNLSTTGSLDKALLEAMASGCVPLSRNESFQALARAHGVPEVIAGDGPEVTADALERLVRLDEDARRALRARLRAIVAESHSLDALTGKIVGHLRELVSERS